MIEWEPNKNDANLNMPVDGQVASICWNEQTKLLTMSLAYSAVYGMGERYNGLNQNDRIVKIEVEEKFCNQGDKSYCPSPFFFTDTGFSFCTLSGGTLIFDFTQKNVIMVHASGNCKFIFNAGTPEKLISEYMSLSGPAILPPDWVFGPWISANHWNTQKETEKQIELLKKYQFPATVLVLEAWSDEATFYIFNGAKYKEKPNGAPFAVGDFDYSESAYWPNPQEMIEKLHKAGLHLVLWQVPVYKRQGDDEIRNHQNDLDREDAVKRSLCIHNLDGTPYKIPEGHWFSGSMIPDFTNPETCKTWFGKRQYLLDMGVDGFKTDGGEFVCTDAVSFYDGSTGKESRNCYPQQYTKAYTQFLCDNHVLFSRAGYMGQHTTPCHWGGDQQSTNDELRHARASRLSEHPAWSEWYRRAENSGGGLFDLHLHDIDYLCYLFGKVKRVYAVGRKNSVGCWNHVATSLTFENGMEATAEGILEMPSGFPFTTELNVVGDKKAYCYHMGAGANLENIAAASRSTTVYGNGKAETLAIDPYDAYQKELEDFIGHIEAGTPITVITPADVRHVLSVIVAIRESLETQKTVTVS